MDAERKVILSRTSLHVRAAYEPPVGEVESKIAELFAEALSVDRIGADDDFFDLGGDSLLGASLAAGISEFIGRDFQISLLVSQNTPRKIASYLLAQASELPKPGKRPPIFMVHGKHGIMLPRPQFLQGLAPGQKLVMFELPGVRGNGVTHETIEAIAADYVRQLQAEYPHGPVLLGGYCHGSVIALEVAAQLAELGRPVLHLILFDPDAPRNVLTALRRISKGTRRFNRRWGRWLSRGWYRLQLRCLEYFLATGRWTDGNNAEDLADERIRRKHERYYRQQLSAHNYRKKLGGVSLSLDAKAKLLAAYRHYLPMPFTGPATVFTSTARSRLFQDPASMWPHLLPNREIHVLGTTHTEVIRASAATGARLMQATFDAAVDRHLTAEARNTQDLSDVS